MKRMQLTSSVRVDYADALQLESPRLHLPFTPELRSTPLHQTSELAPHALIAATPAAQRQLLIDSRKYAEDDSWTSWWHLSSTLALLAALSFCVAWNSNVLLRLACSLIIALTFVRLFIIYHDFLHKAIFKGSTTASFILKIFGHLMLTPPDVWQRSHDHHHRHNSKMFGASIGSFPIMTTAGYQAATYWQRWEYRLARSPLIILCGYLTVFLFGMCIYPLLCDFKKNVHVLGTLVLHFGTIALGVGLFGWSFTFFAFVLPSWLAMLIGSYLFYIQHNFPAAKIIPSVEWNHADAAVLSCSHLETGAVLGWFTGNIGFHHVHHLNAKIPFYRLPEAMAGLHGLQSPGKTSFALGEIVRCLKLKLWDVDANQLVPFAK